MKIIRMTCIVIICCIAETAYSSKRLLSLALAISAAPTRSHRYYAREQLMQEFKNVPHANAQTLAAIVTTYHYKNDTHLCTNHSGTLYEAIDQFSGTSGFSHKIYQLLHSAGNQSFVKGHMYELETALALKKMGEKITHFDYEFYCPLRNCRASIDLVTKNYLIECKNIRWENYILKPQGQDNKLQSQLLSYQALSHDDDENENGLEFILYSKQPIADDWKKWLDQNEIAYKEMCDS